MTAETREKILGVGLDLFQEHGINQVGLDQILQRVKLTKTTFYNHFDSKEALVRATIVERCNEVQNLLQQVAAESRSSSAREKFLAMLLSLSRWCRDNNSGRCLLLSAAFEFPNPHDPTHQLVVEVRAEWVAMIRASAEGAGLQRASEFAVQFMMIIDGLFLCRQVDSNPNAEEIALQTVGYLVDAHTSTS